MGENNNSVLDKLDTIYLATLDITLSKSQSMKIVGGKKRFENLIGLGKIRAKKDGENQNSRWSVNASDVLRYAIHKPMPKRKIKLH